MVTINRGVLISKLKKKFFSLEIWFNTSILKIVITMYVE